MKHDNKIINSKVLNFDKLIICIYRIELCLLIIKKEHNFYILRWHPN